MIRKRDFIQVMLLVVAGFLIGALLTMTVRAQESTADPVTDPTFATPPVIEITPTPVIVEPPPPNPIPDDPTEPPATTPETLLGQLYALLKDGTYIAWAAAGTVVIVGALKLVASALGIAIYDRAAIFLTLVVQTVIWILYAMANYFGQGDTFKAFYLQVVDVVRALLPLAGSIFAGHIIYQKAAAASVPVLGFTPPLKPPVTTIRRDQRGKGWSDIEKFPDPTHRS